MRSFTAFAALLSASFVAAQHTELNADDIPLECSSKRSCLYIIAVGGACTVGQTNSSIFEDDYFLQCACGQRHMDRFLKHCVKCISKYKDGGDVADLQDACQDRMDFDEDD